MRLTKSFIHCSLFIIIIAAASNSKAQYFKSLSFYNIDKRASVAHQIFVDHIQPLDSSRAFYELNYLEKLASASQDYSLLISSYLWKAQIEENLNIPRSDDKKILKFLGVARSIAQKKHLKLELARCISAQGIFEYHRRRYDQAFSLLLQSMTLFTNYGFKKIPGAFSILMDMGFLYYDFDSFEIAQQYFFEAVKYKPSSSWESKMTYTAIGLVYLNKKNYDSALLIFNKVHTIALAENDKTWIGIASGNIGNVYLQEKKYDQAIPFLSIDVANCVAAREWSSAGGSLIKLAEINITKGEYTKALSQLKIADTIISKINNYKLYSNLYKNLAIVYEYFGDNKNAYLNQNKYILFKDSLDRQYENRILHNAQIKFATETYRLNMDHLAAEQEVVVVKRNLIIVALFLAMLVALLLLWRQKAKHQFASKQLDQYKEHIQEKNILIEGIQDELLRIQKHVTSDKLVDEKIIILEKLLQSTILTEEQWQNFKVLFDKVNHGFSTRLRDKYPDLTLAEIRLVTLTKLGLSDREMANMLGVSIDTIRKTRQRLRKKLSSSEKDSIDELIQSL